MILLNDDPIIESMERRGYAPWIDEEDEEEAFEPFAVYDPY